MNVMESDAVFGGQRPSAPTALMRSVHSHKYSCQRGLKRAKERAGQRLVERGRSRPVQKSLQELVLEEHSLNFFGNSVHNLWSHNLRVAVSHLLTVTMHFQDALSRFHCQACMKNTFVSTWRVRRLAPLRFTNPSATRQSLQMSNCSQAPPTSAINLDSPELKQTGARSPWAEGGCSAKGRRRD